MKKLSLLLFFLALQVQAADHVVLVVWDGLRPDFVNTTNTPTLMKLAREGVFFANHRAAFVSSTVVNGVTLMTGAYPARSGILANREYRPQIDPLKAVAMESLDTIRKNDELTGGRHLGAPTLVEILRANGLKASVAGTKPVAQLLDRSRQESFVNPAKYTTPHTSADSETTSALIGKFWDNGVPPLSILWLSEPDLSQHDNGPGSAKALTALRGSDQALASLLDALHAKGVRAKTDVLVVSDHGFSTIARSVDVAEKLSKAGFRAARQFEGPPEKDDVVVVGNGGAVLLYVTGREETQLRKIVEFLQRQDFVGVIFTRDGLPGTFRLSQARLDSRDAPDIVVAMRWMDEPASNGVRGLLITDSGRSRPQGSHGSLSRYDMHNTLVAAGPHFQRGMLNTSPTSNADVAPTILSLFGIKPPTPMDGRILSEALAGGRLPDTPVVVHALEASSDLGTHRWQQYLRVIEVAGALYFDEGNGYSQAVHSETAPATP